MKLVGMSHRFVAWVLAAGTNEYTITVPPNHVYSITGFNTHNPDAVARVSYLRLYSPSTIVFRALSRNDAQLATYISDTEHEWMGATQKGSSIKILCGPGSKIVWRLQAIAGVLTAYISLTYEVYRI